jgi:DNA polymerase-4
MFVLHVDLDQFIVAVELLRRPELRGRPVLVGGTGDPTRRGVVAGASYEARRYGVHSGTPLRTALARCPDALFLPLDMAEYRKASESVMAALAEVSGTLEVVGWDEAFLGVDTECPEDLAHEVQRLVQERTGLSCSVGIGDNKLHAKVASRFAKPGGVRQITDETWMATMGPRPVDALWGVGPRTARSLATAGISTVEELASTDESKLVQAFGSRRGPWLRDLALGRGSTGVSGAPRSAVSHSVQETYQQDLTDPDEKERQVLRLAERVTAEASADGRPFARVTVTARFAPFDTHDHAVGLRPPTRDHDLVAETALRAWRELNGNRPVRMLAVRLTYSRQRDEHL